MFFVRTQFPCLSRVVTMKAQLRQPDGSGLRNCELHHGINGFLAAIFFVLGVIPRRFPGGLFYYGPTCTQWGTYSASGIPGHWQGTVGTARSADGASSSQSSLVIPPIAAAVFSAV